MVDDTRQFMGRGRNRRGSALFGRHPAIELPEIRLAMMERLSRHAKCCGSAILDFTCFDRQHFPTADPIVWTQSESGAQSIASRNFGYSAVSVSASFRTFHIVRLDWSSAFSSKT